jgi:hypothetical protein
VSEFVQVAKGTSYTPIVIFEVNGVGQNLDSGVPTVTLTRPDGTAGPASGTVTSLGAGAYSFVVDPQPEVTWLDYAAVGTVGGRQQTLTGRIEWVGDALFNLSAFRGLRVAGGTPFSLTAIPLFTDRQILDTRAETLEEMTRVLGFSPVARFARETLDGNGLPQLPLHKREATRILSVTVNGVAQTATNYQVGVGNTIEAVTSYGSGTPFTWGRRNVVVEYAHGWQRPEGNTSRMAMLWAAATLNPSGFSSASTVSLPDGSSYTYEPSEVGRSGYVRFSGIREVDRWLNRNRAVAGVA